jgi:hypothetical protein
MSVRMYCVLFDKVEQKCGMKLKQYRFQDRCATAILKKYLLDIDNARLFRKFELSYFNSWSSGLKTEWALSRKNVFSKNHNSSLTKNAATDLQPDPIH